MRRLSPYLILGMLIIAPFLISAITAVEAGQPLQEGEGEGQPVTPETDFGTFVVNVRLDLETLADVVFGEGRPPEWNGNIDPTTPSILGDIWLDLETLADAMAEQEGARPPDWIGASSPTPILIARNLRHDLELLADIEFGRRQRPEAWVGAPRIYTCDRTLQNLVGIMGEALDFRATPRESIFDYCRAVDVETQDMLTAQGVLAREENVPQLLENIRGDLERLADELNGLGERPEDWLGTIVLDSGMMAQDLRHDLELLADQHLDEGERPIDWIGPGSDDPDIAVRDLRRDLELLADITMADRPITRPGGWLGIEGFDDLSLCNPATQNLAVILSALYGFAIPSIEAPDADAFCTIMDAEVNAFAETSPEQLVEAGEGLGRTGRPVAESDYAFAYLDVSALQFMGIMPAGIEFEAWYRNFGESTMMYVVGENFAVYVARDWTTLPENIYFSLPTLQGVIPETYCFAAWCSGPGPTPTSTGQAPTPTPGAAPGGPPPGGGTLVPWNQIAVFYDLDRPDTGTVQVRMELCPDSSLLAGCEPVQNVYDASGNPLPIVNVIGPYPVFELPYGYSNQYILDSDSYYANEVWISDPTLRGVRTN